MTSRFLYLLAVLALAPLAPPAKAQAPCAPEGKVAYICGLQSVEDLVSIPGTQWILGSALKTGAGGVYLIDAKTHTAKPAAIAFEKSQKPFDDCTAPDMARLRTHGLEIRPGAGKIHTLYAINHGERESIEVFRVDARAGEPRVSWIGCLVLPGGANGNSLVALPDGGLAVTKFRDMSDPQGLVHILSGQITGIVYLWKPSSGFSEFAGAQFSGANGIVASHDGKWLFVADYGRKQVFRFALDGSGKVSSVPVDFRPDNLRWAPDGKINVAGQFFDLAQNDNLHDWGAVKLDPDTMTVTPYLQRVVGTAAFDNGTTALQVGQELWVGTFRGDRVAYMPVP